MFIWKCLCFIFVLEGYLTRHKNLGDSSFLLFLSLVLCKFKCWLIFINPAWYSLPFLAPVIWCLLSLLENYQTFFLHPLLLLYSFFSLLLGDFIIMVPMSLNLLFLVFSPLSFCSEFWVISLHLFSSSLIPFSTVSNLPCDPASKF